MDRKVYRMYNLFSKRNFAALLVFLSVAGGAVIPVSAQSREERLRDHLYYLAGPSLRGREAGTEYAAMAADYIKREYSRIGLRPFFNQWESCFRRAGIACCNIIGVIDGSDPVLREEYIVLGAHFDHLGERRGIIYPGADDNASGSSALIEIARELYASRDGLKRSVIIAAFDGEEKGLFGSSFLVDKLADSVGVERIKLMASIDMVGWYRQSGELKLQGVATFRNGEELVSGLASEFDIAVKPGNFEHSILTATDTHGFALKGIPTLAITTGTKSPYHKPGDKPELIDYPGLDKVTGYLIGLAGAVASDPDFTASGKVAPKHRGESDTFEFGLTVGTNGGQIRFRDARFTTHSRPGLTAGAVFRLNGKHLTFDSRVLYERFCTSIPDEGEALRKSLPYLQQSVLVPVSCLYRIENLSFGGGLWYGRTLDAEFQDGAFRQSVSPNQIGYQVTCSLHFGSIFLGWTSLHQLNRMFMDEGAPNARRSMFTFSLGYLF